MSSGEVYLGGNGGTRLQKATGFEDSTENLFNFLMAAHGPQADEAKVRAYAEGAVEHFDWLVERGVPFKDSFLDKLAIVAITDDGLLYTGSEKAWPFRDIAKPVARGHNLQVEGDNGGPLLMKILTENVEQCKNIRVHYDTRTLCLIADEYNTVHGVVVRIDMKERFVKTRKGVDQLEQDLQRAGVSVDAGKKIDDERDSGQLVRCCREDLFGLDGVRVRARDMDADDPELLRPGFEHRNNQ